MFTFALSLPTIFPLFFFNDTATTEIYTLSLHDALPISGALLTTESVLLNPNRNPQLSRKQIEDRLDDYLAARHTVWLGDGIAGDDTDGHIDDLARFVNANTIV